METTITWNSAIAVTDVKKAGVSIGMENYAVNGNILTIKKEYLETQTTGALGLAVEFDRGNAATLAINIHDTTPQIISATISPTTVTFDLDSPGDVSTTISWGSAATVTDVVYGSVYLTSPADYNVSGNILTIKETYLSGLNLTEGNSIDFEISFDAGDSAVLTVNAVSSYVPSGDAALSDLGVGGETVAGFVYKQYEYTVQLPYGTQPGSRQPSSAQRRMTPGQTCASLRLRPCPERPSGGHCRGRHCADLHHTLYCGRATAILQCKPKRADIERRELELRAGYGKLYTKRSQWSNKHNGYPCCSGRKCHGAGERKGC